MKDEKTKLLKCVGRIRGYQPVYLKEGVFTRKLIRHIHEKQMHLSIRQTQWLPFVSSGGFHNWVKPLKVTVTSQLPKFRMEVSRPFQYTGVDFAGPLIYMQGYQAARRQSLHNHIHLCRCTCRTFGGGQIPVYRRISEEVKRVRCQENQTRINRLRQRNGV